MTHCTNCSCPMTCNAFERCVREPDLSAVKPGEWLKGAPQYAAQNGFQQYLERQAFARSATPHRTETP